ncbi:MAG: type II toxin-antitoxin system RelE/ParE family toxin [Chakrabartia sp.]
MQIDHVRNKALRAFLETGNPKGLNPQIVSRLINMIAYIDAVEALDEFKVPPNFGFHILTGNRAGVCSMTVTRNWRLTFMVSEDGGIIELDLEDYH